MPGLVKEGARALCWMLSNWGKGVSDGGIGCLGEGVADVGDEAYGAGADEGCHHEMVEEVEDHGER